MPRPTRSELPPDRDERLAAVKQRGRQLRQRRRLALVTGPAAAVVVVGIAVAALGASAQDDGTRTVIAGDGASTTSSTAPSSTTSTTKPPSGEPGSTTVVPPATVPDEVTTTSTAEAPPGTAPTTTTTTTAPPQEPEAPALRARIELSATTVVSGGTLEGELVVTNEGAEAVRLLERGCRPKWTVFLRGVRRDGGWAHTLECGTEPLVFERGETRLPFTAPAVGLSCDDTVDISHGPAQGQPSCVSVNGPPPLPPGPYEATLGSTSPRLAADPVSVEVVPA